MKFTESLPRCKFIFCELKVTQRARKKRKISTESKRWRQAPPLYQWRVIGVLNDEANSHEALEKKARHEKEKKQAVKVNKHKRKFSRKVPFRTASATDFSRALSKRYRACNFFPFSISWNREDIYLKKKTFFCFWIFAWFSRSRV